MPVSVLPKWIDSIDERSSLSELVCIGDDAVDSVSNSIIELRATHVDKVLMRSEWLVLLGFDESQAREECLVGHLEGHFQSANDTGKLSTNAVNYSLFTLPQYALDGAHVHFCVVYVANVIEERMSTMGLVPFLRISSQRDLQLVQSLHLGCRQRTLRSDCRLDEVSCDFVLPILSGELEPNGLNVDLVDFLTLLVVILLRGRSR